LRVAAVVGVRCSGLRADSGIQRSVSCARNAMNEFAQYIHGQFADLGEVEHARFFGGVGFKLGDIQFAMCMNGTLYLVVDDTTRPHYTQRGSAPFSYATAKGQRLVHRYYAVPDEILEDRDALTQWAQDAVAVAARSRRGKSARR
jgi:TfoX/Sxy family transcriptional regulator of competence genes